MALFRIILALLLIWDLVGRWSLLEVLYTDEGVLPRSALFRSEFRDLWPSLCLGNGDPLTQQILYLLLFASAISLLLGHRTLASTACCWILLNSFNSRNIFANDRGDLEMVLLLFWSLFLPLGARWSLDARSGRSDSRPDSGLPAAALVLQLAMIYGFAAYLKSGDFWILRGDGLYHSLMSPLFASPLAQSLAGGVPPPLLLVANYAVIAGELFVALLLLSPWHVPITRTVALVLCALFHLSVTALFELGLFPMIGLGALAALLPTELWERLSRLQPSKGMWSWKSRPTRPLHWLPKTILGLCLVVAVLSNLSYRPEGPLFRLPEPLGTMGQATRVLQHWELFSPTPPYHGVFELVRYSPDAGFETIASFGTSPPQFATEKLEPFPTHRWRMLFISALFPPGISVRPGLAKALAKRYGIEPEERFLLTFRHRPVQHNGTLGEVVTWRLYP